MENEELEVIAQHYPNHVGLFRALAASEQSKKLYNDVMKAHVGRGLFGDQYQEIPPIDQAVIAPLREQINAIIAFWNTLFEEAKLPTPPKQPGVYQAMFRYTTSMGLAALHLERLEPNKQAQLFTCLFNMAQAFPVGKTRIYLLKILTVLPASCTTAPQRLGIFKVLVNQICNTKASTCTWEHENLPVEALTAHLLDILMATLCFPEWNVEKGKVFVEAVQVTCQQDALLAKCRKDRPNGVEFAQWVPQPADLASYQRGLEMITAALEPKAK